MLLTRRPRRLGRQSLTRVISSLDLRYVDGHRWVLDDDFVAESDELGVMTVEAGESTDFNSIPRGLWNILPPDEYGEAAVLHDHLYHVGTVRGMAVTRQQADRVHREFVRYRHAPPWKVWLMYAGLRVGGWVAWNRYRKEAVGTNQA